MTQRMLRIDGGKSLYALNDAKSKRETEDDVCYYTNLVKKNLKDISSSSHHLPVRAELPIKKSDIAFSPFTIAFCYPVPITDVPFVVKGTEIEVQRYFKNYKLPAIVHYSLWCRKKRVLKVELINFKRKFELSHERDVFRNKQVWALWVLRKYNDFSWQRVLVASFRQLPRKWIKQLNKYLE